MSLSALMLATRTAQRRRGKSYHASVPVIGGLRSAAWFTKAPPGSVTGSHYLTGTGYGYGRPLHGRRKPGRRKSVATGYSHDTGNDERFVVRTDIACLGLPPGAGGENVGIPKMAEPQPTDELRSFSKRAVGPNSASISNRRLYLAIRSLRQADPVLIWPPPMATAKSAIKMSSVSPERWEMT